MHKKSWITGILVICLTLGAVFAQTPTPTKKESNTWRAVGTAGGAAGGFLLGLWIGLAKYDDAIYSERKVTTVVVISTIAGGVGGYFIGRSVDKRNSITWKLDPMDRSLLRAQHAQMGDGRSALGSSGTQERSFPEFLSSK